jgi:hypothetical protein
VGGLAHAHEHHLLHRAPAARERHLGDDLGAAQLAQQTIAPGHAEHAADRAAHLRRHAQSVARQQHALHGLAVGQLHQQALGAVVGGVGRTHLRERAVVTDQRGQRVAQRQRQEVRGTPRAAVGRQRLQPVAQHQRLVRRAGAAVAHALPQFVQAHRVLSCGRGSFRPPASARGRAPWPRSPWR